MSIVKYKNKKTGYITVYESTSYYDPVTKQSRPKRKYLGHEDPVTGELIQSTGQKGRRKGVSVPAPVNDPASGEIDSLLESIAEKDALIETLKLENKALLSRIDELKASIHKALDYIKPYLD